MQSAENNFMPVAQVAKSYGTEGEVMVTIFSDIEDYTVSELLANGSQGENYKRPVFLLIEGLPVPFFIQSIKTKGHNKGIIKFIDIDDIKDAEEIIGHKIYYEKSFLDTIRKDIPSDDLSSLIGYTVYQDTLSNKIGTITNISDFGANICAEITTLEDKEVLIPLHEDLITDLNPLKKQITLIIPAGLI